MQSLLVWYLQYDTPRAVVHPCSAFEQHAFTSTVEALNKGHLGDSLKLNNLSLLERSSSFQRCQLYSINVCLWLNKLGIGYEISAIEILGKNPSVRTCLVLHQINCDTKFLN